ncbi:MAG: CheB methylesterase [Solirubrobacteraceae bacterium]|nr:CheB methylesterase [Solirubrobacteraceae bacterium]
MVLGASAGGVDALSEVVRGFPADLPAAVLAVLHVSASAPSLLAQILDRASVLPATSAADGDRLEEGHIYVARPDLHMTVAGGHVRLTAEARVNGHRPAVDPLFSTAAEAYAAAVVGVVLSGTRDDGTMGLARIKTCGGTAIVQDPGDAHYDGMPTSAIEHVAVDAILPAAEIGPAIAALLAGGELPESSASQDVAALTTASGAGETTALTTVCPDCGGVLSERSESGVMVFRCHVGHYYAPNTLLDLQGNATEAALWIAVRTLEDRQALLARLADKARAHGRAHSAGLFEHQADLATQQADRVREAIAELARGRVAGEPAALHPAEA